MVESLELNLGRLPLVATQESEAEREFMIDYDPRHPGDKPVLTKDEIHPCHCHAERCRGWIKALVVTSTLAISEATSSGFCMKPAESGLAPARA
ncbi:hypothetical protein BOTBODRAFT_174193 [Botryobasidium botryosum FD-172 SS1]|uniref:Post-SET domain-containing protein n=1 Tax=Botryobasidium botryosum (strain FD-172 SS1) TaxID=930990 RepID=A0A067MJU1_BOTB1|nr:hypothetical protein BOTBODRAFT_174193 [Botryobasidium botryosum FD-172 SS1]